jgi:hypothetical protein
MAKGYGCGKLVNVENRKYGLGKSCCYPEWLFNSDCGKVILNKAINKAQQPRVELEKAFEEKKDRHKITTLIQAVVTICHNYIKLRDRGKPCIACGTPYNENFHASHYYKAELYSSLKFNEFNIHGGCQECNLRKEGNLSEYAVRLPKRIGRDAFDNLNYIANQEKRQVFKWDRETLRATRDYYKQKIKELKPP